MRYLTNCCYCGRWITNIRVAIRGDYYHPECHLRWRQNENKGTDRGDVDTGGSGGYEGSDRAEKEKII